VTAVNVLVDRGAKLEAADRQSGTTALMSAAAQNRTAAVEALLDCGAHINARMKDRRTALMLAALLGNVETVRLLRKGVPTSMPETRNSLPPVFGKRIPKK